MTDTQEIIPPMQPGVDHPQHIEVTRQAVAKNVRVKVADVTPSEEVAKNIVDAGTSQFLKTVAHTGSEQIAAAPEDKSADGFNNLLETVRAYTPGGDTDRTVSNNMPANLEEKRREEMTKVS